jgi:uncharacterized SAM-binding protein YcdF (DUF218 family)
MSCWWVLLFIYLFFLPITYALPLYWLEKSYFHNSYKNKKAQAIVILGAGLTNSSRMQQPNLNASLLERVRFGAYLQRKTNLPILVSGAGSHASFTEASVMKQVLEEEFHAHVDFLEERSNSTEENAKFTFEILKEHDIKSIFLVSNSWHLKRAGYMFQKYTHDIEIVPIADFAYASKKFYFDREDFMFSLATPYYQRRFYMELFRLLWLKIF